MNLKEKIQSDYIAAFKSGNSVVKNLLSVVKGDIQTAEKNLVVSSLDDSEVVKILTKFSKNLKENISLSNDEGSKLELSVIESYLPKQMSVDDIQSKISSLVASGVTNIGQIMKEFATLPADKKVVSELAKKAIS